MQRTMWIGALGALVLSACAPQTQAPAEEASVELGRHLVVVAGCNDCHTPGYPESGGRTPEAQWLTGSPVGYRGPWGVSYPTNLRLSAEALSEDDWAENLATRTGLPPMPWPSLHAMSDAERRSLYRFIKSLGPGGDPAPGALPPGAPATGPTYYFMPLEPGERSPR